MASYKGHPSNGNGDEAIFRPLFKTTGKYYVLVLILLSIVGWAFFAWTVQLRQGLGMTGLNRPVFWGFYIINFVFFIGISHAGTLISAILRVTQAGWRRPITRAAEAITVFALMTGPLNIIFDLGRPDRMLHVLQFGRIQSPLLWDVISISTYLIGSLLYLYLPMIPDIALVRDRTKRTDLRWRFYHLLSLGWTGSPQQRKALNRAIGIMAVIIIPIAVSVHTVVSWVMAMTTQPMWHSTIFGPYFVVGAIFSGIAAIIIAMAILRKAFHLEEYLTPRHFRNLGLLLLAFTLIWFYFTFAEYMTTFYGEEPSEMVVLVSKVWGPYAPVFWAMVFLNFFGAFALLAIPKTRNITGIVIASVMVNVGMWLERFTIIVPTLLYPRLPYEAGSYMPSWVEISITAGEFAYMALLYVLFVKVFPIISIWEVREGREEEVLKALPQVQPRPEEA